MRALTNIGLGIFLSVTSIVIVAYFDLLYDKITRPQFKNMNTKEAVILGLLVALFIVVDFFIIKRFVRSLKGK